MLQASGIVLVLLALLPPLCRTTAGPGAARSSRANVPPPSQPDCRCCWLRGMASCARDDLALAGLGLRLASATSGREGRPGRWGYERLRGGGPAADAGEDGMLSSDSMLSPDSGGRAGMGGARGGVASPQRLGPGDGEGAMEGGDSNNDAGDDDSGDEWAGEDTLRDHMQILQSMRAARKNARMHGGEEEARKAAAAAAAVESIFAGVCETQGAAGASAQPVKFVLQGRRTPSSPGTAEALGGGGGQAPARTWENGWWGSDNDGNPAHVNVETLEEALVEAGEGCRVLVESGLHPLPAHVRWIVVPEAGCLHLSVYAHYGTDEGLCRVQSMWRLLEGSHGALQCVGLWSRPCTLSQGDMQDEVCVTLLGGPWRFLHSEILVAPTRGGGGGGGREWGGVALRALGLGECYARACRLGGQSRRRRCGEAVVAEEHAEVRMKNCMLQEARFALARSLHSSLFNATGCLFRAGSYALGLADEAQVSLADVGVWRMKLAVFSLLPAGPATQPLGSAWAGAEQEVGEGWVRGGGTAKLAVRGCTFFGGAPPVLWANKGGATSGVHFDMAPDETYEESSFASSDFDACARGGGWADGGVPANLHGEYGIDHFLQEAVQGVDEAGEGGEGDPGLLDSCAQSLLDEEDSSAVSELFEMYRDGREAEGAAGGGRGQ